ncbi:DUF1801 domain-containing protein [Ulvibacterium marinum]|uniref:DUF1801 domain-containing protein n=1 Tax=Ulvibacterium marinum TaxID=2419782 RepID=A0A3B0C445_9FLAO|nr:DUF1801 domain-containing protein [Ulvibacterium marinum]RKN80835.1 DUF1801 domain-containing protein [Ulvibacterium marinum]
MSSNKTVPTNVPVQEFLDRLEDGNKRKDSYVLLNLMEKISDEPPVMWGPSIIGFGSYHYKYDSGREGDMLRIGFSPRKQNFSLYVGAGAKRNQGFLTKLGKYKMGKSCLYIKRLSDVDMNTLEALIRSTYEHYKKKYNS